MAAFPFESPLTKGSERVILTVLDFALSVDRGKGVHHASLAVGMPPFPFGKPTQEGSRAVASSFTLPLSASLLSVMCWRRGVFDQPVPRGMKGAVYFILLLGCKLFSISYSRFK